MANAIIMAAGLGSRFGEITRTRHKTLLPIGGMPNLERTVNYLLDAGITDITLVTGHLAESFGYLADKYPALRFVHNGFFREYNTVYTFSLVLDRFGDSYVIDGDTVLMDNPFPAAAPDRSCYFTVSREEDGVEWVPAVDGSGRVVRMDITDEKRPTMCGISYWTAADAEVIRSVYPAWMGRETLENPKLYWDNIPLTLFDRIHVVTRELAPRITYELDDMDNYTLVKRIWEERQK